MGLAAIIVIALIALVPIISIWALNTLFVGVLFTTAIPLDIYTYLAMLWFGGMLAGSAHSFKN